MIFDSLAHATTDGKWFSSSLDASADKLEEHMEKFSIDKSILSGLPYTNQNEFILDLAEKNKDKYFAVPMLSNGSKKDISVRCNIYKSKGAKGLKIHPRLSNISLEDKKIDYIYEIANELQLPVFLCSVTTGVKTFKGNYLGSITRILRQHSKVKTVLLHGGYTNLLAVSEEVRNLENVLLDLSATLTRFYDSSVGNDIKFLYRTFEKRLCVGTDFPEYDYGDVLKALDFIGIDKPGKGILGNNLENFLSA